MAIAGSRQEREAEFWDGVVDAAERQHGSLTVSRSDTHDPEMPWLGDFGMGDYLAAMIAQIGLKPGDRVLDMGCGRGFLSVAMALRGAHVTGIDISPRSVEVCRQRAADSGVADACEFRVMDCERPDFPDASFDHVVGFFVLHHLDLNAAATEIGRLLKPGGRAAFVETMGLNPLMMAARAVLPGRFNLEKASSDDEYPLTRTRLDRLKEGFSGSLDVAYPQVVCMRMGVYVPAFRGRLAIRALTAMDRAIAALRLKRLSYYGLVRMARDAAAA